MLRILLAVIDAFVAITAVGGGLAMAAGVDRRVDAAWLTGTPFHSFRVPGLLLAGLVGGSATVAAFTAFAGWGSAGPLSVLAGGILVIWISFEVVVLDQPAAPTGAEAFYFALGLVMTVLGLAVGAA